MSATTQPTDVKTCSKCGIEKPCPLFSARSGYGDGLNAWCKDCHSKYAHVYNRTHKPKKLSSEQLRVVNYRRVHGIAVSDYDDMFRAQGGKCAICTSTNPGGPRHFTVDHDHRTGQIRGLLCRYCNAGLGMFNDSIFGLMRAADYVYERRMS